MKLISRLDRILAACECLLTVGLFIVLMGVLTLNILLRNLIGTSLPGTFEIAAALVLWLALVGGSLALRDRRHIKIEFLRRLLPASGRRWADRAVSLFGVVVMGVMFVTAVSFTLNEIAIFGRSGWLAVIFPLFFALAVFRFGLQLLAAFARFPYRPEWPGVFKPKPPSAS
ncbi:MAG: TRAP transporter small permease [Desulfosarcinaceae bacterium]|jgi:TRAP-type C4-dicarboxylate transport system permease small subunit